MNFNLDENMGYDTEIVDALIKAFDSRQYIYGPQVKSFEQEWAAYTGQAHCVGVGNGTDAIRIGLLALGIKPGDEVISPAFNVAYTALAVAAIGAVNIFVDCDPLTMLMDLNKVAAAITPRTRAIIPVHLYGRMVDVKGLRAIAKAHGLMILEDAAQCHGATYEGNPPGEFSEAVAYSFYPTKNLGALGEAGGITTNVATVADRARLLRDGGRADRYLHTMIGINSGLDEIQAAVLRVKLRHLAASNGMRRTAAQRYHDGLAGLGTVRVIRSRFNPDSVQHLYVIRAERRDELHEYLKTRGVPTLIHYPIPVPYQPCFMGATMGGPWPETEKAAREVLSLPMFPSITEGQQKHVVQCIKDFYDKT